MKKTFYLSPKPITDFRGGDRMGFFVFRNTAMMISVKVGFSCDIEVNR